MSLNVAVWGLGSHAQRNIIPALMECNRTELHGVWTRSPDVCRDVSKTYGILSYTSESEMLEDASVDVIIVATPVGMHHEHGLAVLRSGKHLWCEKSLASDVSQIQELIDASLQFDRQVHELFMFLHHPQFLAIEDAVVSGKIGTLRSLTARFGFPHLPRDNIRYNSKLGGGSLLDAGCYPIAAAHALIGPKPVAFSSNLWAEDGYDVDTQGSAHLVYPNGCRAHLEWGFGHSYRNEIEVWGSDGWLRAERAFSKPSSLSTTVEIHQQGGSSIIEIDPADHFSLMFEHFSSLPKNDWALAQGSLIEILRTQSSPD